MSYYCEECDHSEDTHYDGLEEGDECDCCDAGDFQPYDDDDDDDDDDEEEDG